MHLWSIFQTKLTLQGLIFLEGSELPVRSCFLTLNIVFFYLSIFNQCISCHFYQHIPVNSQNRASYSD